MLEEQESDEEDDGQEVQNVNEPVHVLEESMNEENLG